MPCSVWSCVPLHARLLSGITNRAWYLVSAFLAGMKRSTGLTWALCDDKPRITPLYLLTSVCPRLSFKTDQVAGENKEVSKWMEKYLSVGEWVMDQSVAIAGSSGFFERRRWALKFGLSYVAWVGSAATNVPDHVRPRHVFILSKSMIVDEYTVLKSHLARHRSYLNHATPFVDCCLWELTVMSNSVQTCSGVVLVYSLITLTWLLVCYVLRFVVPCWCVIVIEQMKSHIQRNIYIHLSPCATIIWHHVDRFADYAGRTTLNLFTSR